MSSEQASTRTATGRRFGRRTESEAGTDVLLRDQNAAVNIMLLSHSVDDYQTLDMHDWGGQTATRGARVDAARQMYQTRDIISSIEVMNARTGFVWGMEAGQWRRDVESIAHMSEEDVIDELVAKGLAGVAKRLRHLYDVTEEDEEDIKPDSLRGFATLMIKNSGMHLPQITITDDGLIQAVWRHSRQGTLVMNFQESGDVEFTLLYGRWDQGTKRRRLSGELHPDQAMLHVDHFVRKIMET